MAEIIEGLLLGQQPNQVLALPGTSQAGAWQSQINFAHDFSNFLKENVNIVSTDEAIHFLMWFLLGSVLNLPESGLMTKMELSDIFVKYDDSVRAIKIGFAQRSSSTGKIKLVLRTIFMNPMDRRGQDVITFSMKDLTELAYRWNIDYFHLPDYEMDVRYLEFYTYYEFAISKRLYNIQWKDQLDSPIKDALIFICKEKLANEIVKKPVSLGQLEFIEVTDVNSFKVQEMIDPLVTLSKPNPLAVKRSTVTLMTKLHNTFHKYRHQISLQSSENGHIAYTMGAFVMNFRKQFLLNCKLFHSLATNQGLIFAVASKADYNPKLRANVPLYVTATNGRANPSTKLTFLTKNTVRPMLPSYSTDSSLAVLAVVNYDFPNQYYSNAITTVEINEGFLHKLLHVYDNPELSRDGINHLSYELQFELWKMGNIDADLYESFFHGQMLSLHAEDIHKEEKWDLKTYKFTHDKLILNDQVSTYLISHGENMLNIHIHKLRTNPSNFVHEQFASIHSKVLPVENLIEHEYFYNIHIFVGDATLSSYTFMGKTTIQDILTGKYKYFKGTAAPLEKINVVRFLDSIQSENLESARPILYDALQMSQDYIRSDNNLKMFIKGLFNPKATLMSKFEHHSVNHMMIALVPRQIPHTSEEYTLSEMLRSPPQADNILSYSKALLINLKYSDQAFNPAEAINDQMVQQFWQEYYNKFAFTDQEQSPVFLNVLISKAQAQTAQEPINLSFNKVIRLISPRDRRRTSASSSSSTTVSLGSNCEMRLRKRTGQCPSWIKFLGENDNKERKIEIDSDELLDDLLIHKDENERMKIFDYINSLDETKVDMTGEKRKQLTQLAKTGKSMSQFQKIGTAASIGTMLLMGKDIVSNIFQGNYKGALVTSSFIVAAPVLGHVSTLMSMRGMKYLETGSRLASISLRATAPLVGKLTSAFLIYDLINNINALKSGTVDSNIAKANIFADGSLLAIDVAEIGIQLAETFGVIEGVSSTFGPIGSAIGAIIFIGVDIYSSIQKVKTIENKLKLTNDEKFYEGVRAFFGAPPEKHIEQLIEEKEHYQQLINNAVKFLRDNPNFKSYAFPTQTLIEKNWVDDENNYILMNRSHHLEKLVRNKPDLPIESEFVCFNTISHIEPVGFKETVLSYVLPTSLFDALKLYSWHTDLQPGMQDELVEASCRYAMGVSLTKNKGRGTLIDLRHGNDTVHGTQLTPNIFLIGNGLKHVIGGQEDDVFIFNSNTTSGFYYGMNGSDTADFSTFAMDAKELRISTIGGQFANVTNNLNKHQQLHLSDFENFVGRQNKKDIIHLSCSSKSVNSQNGETAELRDKIFVKDSICFYNLTIVVGRHIKTKNRAKFGQFDYIITNNSLADIYLSTYTKATHRIIFNNRLEDLTRISKVKGHRRISFIFGETGQQVILHHVPFDGCSFYFGGTAELKISFQDSLHLHAYIGDNTVAPLEASLFNNYVNLATKLNCSITVHFSVENTTLIIPNPTGDENSHVIHNDPYHPTIISGFDQENVYTINYANSRKIDGNVKIPKVTIYSTGFSKKVKTIDLSALSAHLKEDVNGSLRLSIEESNGDLILVLDCISLSDSSYTVGSIQIMGTQNYISHHVVVNNIGYEISNGTVCGFSQKCLRPLPLFLPDDLDHVILSEFDIFLENLTLFINKTADKIEFLRSNQSLILYEPVEETNEAFYIILSGFYNNSTLLLKTLKLSFSNRLIDLSVKAVYEDAVDLSKKMQKMRIVQKQLYTYHAHHQYNSIKEVKLIE